MAKNKVKEFCFMKTVEFMKVFNIIKEGDWESNFRHGTGF